jgi:hypothetical protein
MDLLGIRFMALLGFSRYRLQAAKAARRSFSGWDFLSRVSTEGGKVGLLDPLQLRVLGLVVCQNFPPGSLEGPKHPHIKGPQLVCTIRRQTD